MKSSKKAFFGSPMCCGMGYPTFRTHVFKSQLLLSIWPVMVKFRSARSEGTGQNKEDRRITVNLSPPTSMSGGLTMAINNY